ncbi:hypothetical protein [Dyadobacter pollutisoli]|jgi:hypothetical protein|uniref:Uncharacterized protein n=1 Tax=Dyadobacter pollutisoli TaxID=2910158 RepID=A0A9E8SMZ4_9BACT|nr:hypothetical protein [Dyadobacter pollutisoli]WAC14703.1 hypothetical protein ON006_12220 [Dyadobacter pollutisoli]
MGKASFFWVSMLFHGQLRPFVDFNAYVAAGYGLHDLDGHSAAGALIVGVVLLGEEITVARSHAALLIVAGIVLMKLSASH